MSLQACRRLWVSATSWACNLESERRRRGAVGTEEGNGGRLVGSDMLIDVGCIFWWKCPIIDQLVGSMYIVCDMRGRRLCRGMIGNHDVI